MCISFKPIWFDSLGAKSSCTLVKTADVSILIDPGVAIMHPSFPASYSEKIRWREQGKREIKKVSKEAEVLVISHYHYDHYSPGDMNIYEDKLLLVKNPNEYINDSQRKRAEAFYSNICEHFGGIKLESILTEPKTRWYPNPLDGLPLAKSKNFGDYENRRKELLNKGLSLFKKRTRKWNKWFQIPEFEFDRVKIKFADGKEFSFGETRIRFTKPLFHGIEFSTLGWVIATVIECGSEKLIHSSDLNGPIIEDYAEWIIKEDPDILILDGPMTYMFGYLLNRINLNRAVANAVRIIEESDARLIIYDHHLVREAKFREHTIKVWKVAKRSNKKVFTAAEFLGLIPKVLECKRE